MSNYPAVPQPFPASYDKYTAQPHAQQLPYHHQHTDAGSLNYLLDEEDVHLREQHASFRLGAGQQMHRQSTGKAGTPTAPPPPAGLAAAELAPEAASMKQKHRRRWADDTDDARRGSDDPDLIPAVRPDVSNTGHMVRMRRGEAWGKFLAYEGCCQVCMKEGARGVPEASYFLSSGCEPLRAGLGITNLLLPQVLASHMASAVGVCNPNLDLGNEIHWDDYDADDRKLNATAFINHMNVMKVRVARLDLQQPGMNMLSRLVCRNADYSHITVHFKVVPGEALRPAVDVPFRLRKDGAALPGSPVFDLQPEHHNQEVLLEVVQGTEVLARGKVPCKRLWQMGMEHAPAEETFDAEEGCDAERSSSPSKGSICSWLKGDADAQLLKGGGIALWVNVFDSSLTPGKVLLMVHRSLRELPGSDGLREEVNSRGMLKVSSCQAFDYLLQAALNAQGCNEKRLEVNGEWAWLLQAFANHYGVRSNYAVMTHLRWVLRPGIASVSQTCFDLLSRQLRPLLEQEMISGSLTQQEATMLARIKADTEELLKLAFENYYLLSSAGRKGILDGACSPPPGHIEFPPMALVAGVHLFETMRDVFHPSDVEWLADRFRIAAKSRWNRLANLCDDGLQLDACSPLMTNTAPLRHNRPPTRGCGAAPLSKSGLGLHLYSKMLRIAAAVQQDLEFDRQLQDVPRLLPSSLNLAAITAAEFCVNYVHQLRTVLGQSPPNQPTEAAIDLLVGVAQLQRYLDQHNLAVPRGQPGFIDSLELFGPHVRSWITNSQEQLCAACRTLEASTEVSSLSSSATQAAPPLGSSEEGGVAPICVDMLRNVVGEMHRYERVITHWPLFGPYLEAALCVVLRSILAAVSRQCGMMRVRGDEGHLAAPSSSGRSLASPFKHRSNTPGPQYSHGDLRNSRPHSSMAQWVWIHDSPRKNAPGNVRVLLMVREAVLLNTLKHLMVAVPQYEGRINKWSGGYAQPPLGARHASDITTELGYEDVAPNVGAQFAQMVKELRTEYSSALGSTCQRLSATLTANTSTSIYSVLSQAKLACAQVGPGMTPMQQHAMMDSLSSNLFTCLGELMVNLASALDSRVFVATGRGLWDFVGRDLLEFVENLQESKDNKGAWRTRQNASLLLEFINNFFRTRLVQAMPHNLQEQDLAVPLHIDALQKLLAGNSTAVNQNFTPF
eukprot:gene4797-5047_t